MQTVSSSSSNSGQIQKFEFNFSADTRPFHVFQAYAQFRKTKFRQWSIHTWNREIGMNCRSTLMEIMQGKKLPDEALAHKLLDSMQADEALRKELLKLLEVHRLKKAARNAS